MEFLADDIFSPRDIKSDKALQTAENSLKTIKIPCIFPVFREFCRPQ
jgi:hypothetical protein